MRFFDIIKKRKKPGADTVDCLYDYKQKMEKYKKLKKGELSSVTEADLRTAVMSWIFGKFNRNWSNQYEAIISLPKPCRDVYACCSVVDEINNGGLNQLFFNSTGQFAQMAQEGFLALGSDNLSNIMKEAIEIYEKNKALLEKYKDGTLKSFSGSYCESLFDELDKRFFEVESGFDNLMQAYIRKNENFFGD